MLELDLSGQAARIAAAAGVLLVALALVVSKIRTGLRRRRVRAAIRHGLTLLGPAREALGGGSMDGQPAWSRPEGLFGAEQLEHVQASIGVTEARTEWVTADGERLALSVQRRSRDQVVDDGWFTVTRSLPGRLPLGLRARSRQPDKDATARPFAARFALPSYDEETTEVFFVDKALRKGLVRLATRSGARGGDIDADDDDRFTLAYRRVLDPTVSSADLVADAEQVDALARSIAARAQQPDIASRPRPRRSAAALRKEAQGAKPWTQGVFVVGMLVAGGALQCANATWKQAMMRILDTSDVVFMDLAGFDASAQGCVFELRTVMHRVPLRRFVAVVDATTDEEFLTTTLQQMWRERSADSVNPAGDGELELIRINGSADHARTRADQAPDTSAQALTGLLLERAAARPGY